MSKGECRWREWLIYAPSDALCFATPLNISQKEPVLFLHQVLIDGKIPRYVKMTMENKGDHL